MDWLLVAGFESSRVDPTKNIEEFKKFKIKTVDK